MMIISGAPGLGKTTLALSAPAPFLFDTDDGVARVKAEHRCPTSTVSSYDELLDDMGSEEYREAQTVIIDTGGTLVQLMKPWAKKQDRRAATNGMAMFGVIKQEFDRLCNQIRAQDQKHLVVVFHTTEQVKNDTVQTRLSCEGATKDIVWTPADFGGHMFMSGGKRVIGFTPTDEYFAKGCFGVSGVMQVAELQPKQPNTFLAQLFQRAQQQIAEDADLYEAEREAYQAAMEQGKAAIASVIDPDTAKAVTNELANMQHALTSRAELRGALKARLNDLHLKWDKEAGVYVLDDTEPAK
ncbi:MAG: AAA domain protein [Caudoviricetes sp.]|nr:MAG: AAA domain protein [Caudoviricetes sp.]